MNERFKYTSRICPECGGEIVRCVFKGELYCLKCGLVQEDKPFDYLLDDEVGTIDNMMHESENYKVFDTYGEG